LHRRIFGLCVTLSEPQSPAEGVGTAVISRGVSNCGVAWETSELHLGFLTVQQRLWDWSIQGRRRLTFRRCRVLVGRACTRWTRGRRGEVKGGYKNRHLPSQLRLFERRTETGPERHHHHRRSLPHDYPTLPHDVTHNLPPHSLHSPLTPIPLLPPSLPPRRTDPQHSLSVSLSVDKPMASVSMPHRQAVLGGSQRTRQVRQVGAAATASR
jgi:hypothetical protein